MNENRKQHLDCAIYGDLPPTQAHVVMVYWQDSLRGFGIPAVISTSRLVTAASSCRLEPTVTAFGPGRAGTSTTRPGARAYTTITPLRLSRNTKSPAQGPSSQSQGQPKRRRRRWRPKAALSVSRRCRRRGSCRSQRRGRLPMPAARSAADAGGGGSCRCLWRGKLPMPAAW